MREYVLAPPRGVTLLEMLISLAILALLFGISSVSFAHRALSHATPTVELVRDSVRIRAIRDRRATLGRVPTPHGALTVLALPDGRTFVATGAGAVR